MSEQDIATEAPVEAVETAPQEGNTSPEVKAETPEQDTNNEAVEAKEETVEEKLARLESLEKKSQDARKKINAQRKHIASLQKAADERAAKLQEFEAQQHSAESNEPVKPVVDDYETYEDYEKAQSAYVDELANFRAKEAIKKERQELLHREAQEAQLKAQKERSIQYEGQKKAFMEVAPDFVDSEAEFNDYVQQTMGNASPQVLDAIVTQTYNEEGIGAPELIHYFGANGGENLVEFDKISKLNPAQAAVEIYKIQLKLKANPTKREKSEPLPKPPEKVKGSGGSKSKSLSDMSSDELLKWASS